MSNKTREEIIAANRISNYQYWSQHFFEISQRMIVDKMQVTVFELQSIKTALQQAMSFYAILDPADKAHYRVSYDKLMREREVLGLSRVQEVTTLRWYKKV